MSEISTTFITGDCSRLEELRKEAEDLRADNSVDGEVDVQLDPLLVAAYERPQ